MTDTRQETNLENNKKRAWSIHGEKYDLSSFIEKHPGGTQVLERANFMEDCGVMFEIYHAFSDKERIRTQLQNYLIPEKDLNQYNIKKPRSPIPKYDFTEHNELVKIIKEYYPNRESIKADYFWYFKTLVLFSLFLITFYITMFSQQSTLIRSIVGFCSGALWVMVGFNEMHDGSHYGISKYPQVNQFLEKCWNSFGLWNSVIWSLHHVYAHHSYTGHDKLDPDIRHYRPFAVKFIGQSSVLYFFRKVQHFTITFIATILPGMYYGQMIAYINGAIKGKMMGTPLPKNVFTHTQWFEIFLSILSLYCLWQGLFLPTMMYSMAQNIFYHFNIAPDHDTYENNVDNKVEGRTNNWLRMQILNSGNFYAQNSLWTNLFGGINLQIEHHIFPNMSHVHYSTIQPIIEAYSKKKGYSYVNHPNLWSAYKSFLKMMKYQALQAFGVKKIEY